MTCPTKWTFSPQVTEIGGIPTPSIEPPEYTAYSNILLYYPYFGATHNITLRAPIFGDSRVLTVEATRDTTMANVLLIGRNPLWPIINVFTYSFTGLDEGVIDDYFEFVKASVGKEIGLRDHRGQTWRGFILNPDGQSTQEQECNNDLEISFRGTFDGP